MKLHLGSGQHRFEGFTNVDRFSDSADYKWDAADLPRYVKANSIDEILAIHLVESFHQWQLTPVLRGWISVLKPGGKLTIEGTDLDATMQMAQSADPSTRQYGEWGLFGNQKDPEAMANPDTLHRYVWRTADLAELIASLGMEIRAIERAKFHVPARDFRIEAVKL